MAGCLFLCYWPDFQREAPEQEPSSALVAWGLRRQLALRWPRYAAYAWTGAGSTASAEAFARWGFRSLPAEPDAETFAATLNAHPGTDHLVLAMHPERAVTLLAHSPEHRKVEVWSPTEAAAGSSDLFPVSPLAEVLHLATANPVALFVDWSVVDAAAPGVEVRRAIRECVRHASLVGAVVTARVFGVRADGAVLEVAGPEPSIALPESVAAPILRHRVEEALHAELAALLAAPHPPRTWIVVSHAPAVGELIGPAHEAGIRVLLWPVDDSALPVEVSAAADGCASLGGLLGASLGPAVERSAPRPAAREMEPDRDETLPDPNAAGARLGPWVRLVYHAECLLRQSRTTRMPFRKLAAALAELEEFGPTPTNATLWINRARAEAIILTEPEWHRADPSVRVVACRPNGDHPLVRTAIEVPDRCLRLLHQMLQKIPWVSFKLLRNVLLREQWLGGAPYHLDGACIDEWLNFLIHDGAIRMTKEPNLVNPDYPVTALRLNHDHPLSRTVVAEAVEGTRLAAERAILAVDHFMTRNRKPWMAMGALRRALEAMGREELQAVLQGLQNLGALVTESYPNPQKEHSTTGCRLKSDEPIVTEALHVRNSIIRVTQQHQRVRNWVPLIQVNEELNHHCGDAPSPAHRLAWFLLLRDEGILELDHDGHLPGTGWESVRCRLNLTDAVVRSVVSDRLDSQDGEDELPVPPITAEAHIEVRLSDVERPAVATQPAVHLG